MNQQIKEIIHDYMSKLKDHKTLIGDDCGWLTNYFMAVAALTILRLQDDDFKNSMLKTPPHVLIDNMRDAMERMDNFPGPLFINDVNSYDQLKTLFLMLRD